MSMMLVIAYVVLFLSFFNLMRMAVFLIGGDVYDMKRLRRVARSKKIETQDTKRPYRPLVSVLVPAHNEEVTLRRTLDSVYNSTYKNIELIIINDSSTDRTFNIARYFQRRYKTRFKRVKLINVQVRGKARALNAALAHAKGSIFMCLDSDSALTPQALAIMVEQFGEDKTLACMAANVKIFPGRGALNLFQRVEYLVCYQMKKTEAAANIQYIVGGIGSIFRTNIVKRLGLYDTDTITEDIDLSMKIIANYGNRYRIGYHPNAIVNTEQVHDLAGLMRQRFRWKYGRYQVFLKHKQLFWHRGSDQNKILSWVYLPYALLSELFYALEPLIFILIGYLILSYGDATLIAASFVVFTFYTTMHVTAATSGYSVDERLRLIASAPFAYIGMYVLSLVEYTATIRGFINARKLIRNYKYGEGSCDWKHVARKGATTTS